MKLLLPILLLLSLYNTATAQTTNTYTFNNNIVIPGDQNSGNYFPANLSVSSASSVITKVVVTLTGLEMSAECVTAAWLTSPSGKTISLFGRNGDCSGFSGNLVLDQSSSNTFPGIYSSHFNPGTYQPTSGGGVDLPAGTTANLNDLNGTSPNGTWKLYLYIAVARDDYNASLNAWSIAITTIPEIATNTITAPTTSSFCSSSNPSAITGSTPTGGNGSYTYKWQNSTNNTTFNDIVSSNTINYDPPTISQTTYYRRIVTSSAAVDTSNTVTLTIETALGSNTITAPANDTFYTATGNAGTIIGAIPTGGNGSYGYQWQNSTDNNTFTDIPSGATGSNYNPPAISTTTWYRRLVTSGLCTTESPSNALPIGILYTSWDGSTSTDWADATNWSNKIPGIGYKVNIPVTANNPVYSSATSIKELVLATGTTLTVNADLNVSGDLTNNGTIQGSNTLVLNGSTAQNITGTGTIKYLALSNSAGAVIASGSNEQRITGVYNPLAGTLTTNGNLTLGSTAAGTASILNGTGTYISGNVTVERFIPADTRKAYTLVSSPVNSPTIYQAWQEGGSTAATGYGTQITGPTGTSAANGFDATSASGLASIFTYDDTKPSGSKWTSLTNTNINTLGTGKGYLLYVRGDRSILPATPTGGNTTLRATGTLATGTVTFNTASGLIGGAGIFNLVANPFQCPISWTTAGAITGVSRAQLAASFSVYDPNLKVFVTSTGNIISPAVPGTQQQVRYIQPGQAFFIESSGASPVLTIPETTKDTASPTVVSETVFGAQETNAARLNINVYTKENEFTDGAVALFDAAYHNGINSSVAGKLTNLGATFALLRNQKPLSIEGRKQVAGTDTLFFSMAGFAKKDYRLVIDALQFKDATSATLTDSYTATTQPLNLTGSTAYNFTVNGDAASADGSRFTIVLGKAATATTADQPAESLLVTISPNPAKNHIKVNFKNALAAKTTITITNSLGQVVKTINAGTVNNGNLTVNINSLSAGLYNVQLLSNGKAVATQKIVKE